MPVNLHHSVTFYIEVTTEQEYPPLTRMNIKYTLKATFIKSLYIRQIRFKRSLFSLDLDNISNISIPLSIRSPRSSSPLQYTIFYSFFSISFWRNFLPCHLLFQVSTIFYIWTLIMFKPFYLLSSLLFSSFFRFSFLFFCFLFFIQDLPHLFQSLLIFQSLSLPVFFPVF